MAGSYPHIVGNDGNFIDNDSFIEMIENLGDAYEMAEEMYGMIWYLARLANNPRGVVATAHDHYTEGLAFAREVNGV